MVSNAKKAEEATNLIHEDLRVCPLLSVKFEKQLLSKLEKAHPQGAFNGRGFCLVGIRFLILGTVNRVVVYDVMALRSAGGTASTLARFTLLSDVLPAGVKRFFLRTDVLKVGCGLTNTLFGQIQKLGLPPMENVVNTQELLKSLADKEVFEPAQRDSWGPCDMEHQTAWVYGLKSPDLSHRPFDEKTVSDRKSKDHQVPLGKSGGLYQWTSPLTPTHLGYLFTEGRVPILVCLDILAELVSFAEVPVHNRSLHDVVLGELHKCVIKATSRFSPKREDVTDILEAHLYVGPQDKCRGKLNDFVNGAWQHNGYFLTTRFPTMTFRTPSGQKIGPSGGKGEGQTAMKAAEAKEATQEELEEAQRRQEILEARQKMPSVWTGVLPEAVLVERRPSVASEARQSSEPSLATCASAANMSSSVSRAELLEMQAQLLAMAARTGEAAKTAPEAEPSKAASDSGRSGRSGKSMMSSIVVVPPRPSEKERSVDSRAQSREKSRRRRSSSRSSYERNPRAGPSRRDSRARGSSRRRSREAERKPYSKRSRQTSKDSGSKSSRDQPKKDWRKSRGKGSTGRSGKGSEASKSNPTKGKSQEQPPVGQVQPKVVTPTVSAGKKDVLTTEELGQVEDSWRKPEVITLHLQEMARQVQALQFVFCNPAEMERISYKHVLPFDMFCEICAQFRCCAASCERPARVCAYPPCRQRSHDIMVCPVLQNRCTSCGYRGHLAAMCKERSPQEWFLQFETWRTRGWYTKFADLYFNFGFFELAPQVIAGQRYMRPYSQVLRNHGYDVAEIRSYLDYLSDKVGRGR
jgi:hypothetical protein